MRIGIDGGCLSNRRGFGRFARQLTHALAQAETNHEFVMLLDSASDGSVTLPDRFERVVVNVSNAPAAAARAGGRRALGDMLAMGRAAAKARLDLLFFPATYSYFPTWNAGKIVVVMHDALQYVHPTLVFDSLKCRLAWRLKEAVAGIAADRIVTVSEASRAMLAQHAGWPAGKLRVITEGPDPIFNPASDPPRTRAILDRLGIPGADPLLLFVGGPSPHKNLPRLIEAFGRLQHRDARLVLVGDLNDSFHSQASEIRHAAEHSPARARIVLAGFTPDEDLACLYRHARALVFPSLLEGFGLPAVEAMACGTPVLASRGSGSLPEVVGPAGDFFDPLDPADIAHCIDRFLDDHNRAQSLAAHALAQAQRFTWERAARLLLDCFDELGPASHTSAA